MHYNALVVLIRNSALLIALSALYSLLARFRKKNPLLFRLLIGLLFGFAAVAGMQMPFRPAPGIICDARSLVLSMAGLFGGVTAAAVSAALAAIYRVWAGGAGLWAGLAVIAVSPLIGLAFRRICNNRPDKMGPLSFYVFGLITQTVVLSCLLILPHPGAYEVLGRLWLPTMLVLPPATMLCAILIRNEEQRVLLEQHLWVSREDFRITLDSIGNAVISTDKKGLITGMNRVARALTGWSQEEAAGRPVEDIFRIVNEQTRSVVESPVPKVLSEGLVVGLANHTVLIARDGREIPIADSGAPIRNEQGEILGVVLVFRDQSEERTARKLVEARMQIVESAAFNPLDEFLRKALDRIGELLESPLGFYHFVESDQKTISFQQWSTRAINEFCRAGAARSQCGIDRAGVWAECLRERKPLIHNARSSLEHKKAMPEGHAEVFRQLAFPVMREGKVVAILGLGNKPVEYTPKDIETVALLADSIWEIVERKREEAARREREEINKAILNQTIEGFVLVDSETLRFAEFNDAACNSLGYSREEFARLSLFDLHADCNTREEFAEQIRQLLAAGRTHSEDRQKRKDGSFRDVLVGNRVIDIHGRKYWVGVWLDITERKQTEMELLKAKTEWELTFDSVPDMIAIIDTHHRIVRVNKAMAQKFGLAQERWVGMNCFRIAHNSDRPPEYCPLSLLLRDGLEHIVEVHDEQLGGDFLIRVTPLRDSEGQMIGAVHYIQDVTGQRALERQVRQAQKMEALGALAGGKAHDFNNILAIITGYTDIALIELSENSSVGGALRNVQKASSRAKDLVAQILTFSRKSERERKPVEVGPIIREAVKLLRASLPATIRIDAALDTEGIISADPSEIQQIVMNLCANAGHAMRDKGGVLTVSLEGVRIGVQAGPELRQLRPGPHLLLTVEDTGPGIEPRIIERIFEPYFTTKGPGEGTGMGLALVHGIVKNLGGAVEVLSRREQGTTFRVYLPMLGMEMEKAAVAPARELPHGSGEPILFVDDEPAIADIGLVMLTRLGYEVSVSSSSLEALEIFRNSPDMFDLIITDQTMPNLTGLELAGQVHRIRDDIPIILCTGYSEQLSEGRSKECGISALLMKPVSMEELAPIIRKILDQNQARKAAPTLQ